MCCLWGMLLSLHTAAKEFRNRYREVGHGKCGRIQPAVAVQHAVQHAYQVANRVLWRPCAATASLRGERSAQAYVPGLGSFAEPWYWSVSPASENRQ